MVPSYEGFFGPILLALSNGPKSVTSVAEAVSDALQLSPEARGELIAYDGEPVYRARSRLALADLRRAELVAQHDDGRYALTEHGRELADRGAPNLSRKNLEAYPAYAVYRAQYLARRGA